MEHIRPAEEKDLYRIAEIEVFCYRLNFYPIFRNDGFYFEELQVNSLAEELRSSLGAIRVYDDGVVKGFIQIEGDQIRKLFVEPVLQGQAIGSALLTYAVTRCRACWLWALEKNTRAIRFYQRHGFRLTAVRIHEEDTEEYLVRMERITAG